MDVLKYIYPLNFHPCQFLDRVQLQGTSLALPLISSTMCTFKNIGTKGAQVYCGLQPKSIPMLTLYIPHVSLSIVL